MQKRKEVVLMYHLNQDKGRKIRMICLSAGFRFKVIQPEAYLEPIGFLAGMKNIPATNEIYTGHDFSDEMLVMSQFTDESLNYFLGAIRNAKLSTVDLKAVITETNCTWNTLTLYDELRKEHAAFHKEI